MEIDWLPRGEVQYRVHRGCSAQEAPENCFAGQSTLIQYKDCHESCDTRFGVQNGCNTGLNAIAARFAPDEGKRVTECRSCSLFQNEDGNFYGNLNCPKNTDRVANQICPIYASTACYEAFSNHESYDLFDDNQVEDVFRGCSSFLLSVNEIDPTKQSCGIIDINDTPHQICKRTCTEDKCNIYSPPGFLIRVACLLWQRLFQNNEING